MTRVASLPVQRELAGLLSQQNVRLSQDLVQQGSGLKVSTYEDLGADTSKLLSAQGAIDQIDAQKRISDRVGAQLSIYQTRIAEVDSTMTSLGTSVLSVIGGQDGGTLSATVKAAFDQFRASVNAQYDNQALFGGSRTEGLPFKPATLADTATATPQQAIDDDGVRGTAHLGDGVDVAYGVGLADFGDAFLAAFGTLAKIGDLSSKPTDAQLDQLAVAKRQIQDGLTALRRADASNGNTQNRVEQIANQAQSRRTVLAGFAGSMRDADLASLATEVILRKQGLELSKSAVQIANQMSLMNYLPQAGS